MPFYDEQIIEQIEQATDIFSIVQDYVPLKRAGKNYKGCCPFHKEKTPSFVVSPDRQTYHCFGCNVGGDVFDFLMRIDGLSFPEAVRHLAGLANIELPAYSSEDRARSSRREKLLGIYELAGRFFSAYYKDEEHGRRVREYMSGRGFDPKTLEEFGIGFAPLLPTKLLEAFKRKGLAEEDIISSGLVSRTQYGKSLDLFRNRVIFPIHNVQGKIIGFGGRVMDDAMPKYINSPESELFKKRRELFGLHLAKRHIDRDDPYLIIVEGYLDVIRLHEAGIRNAVATLGTALTEEHAQLLKRYAKEIVLVFDGDAAGEAASLRGLETFLEQGMSMRMVAMPQGEDPDDFVRKRGKDAFIELVHAGDDMFTFKLKLLMKRHNHREIKGLLAITREMVATLAKVPNAVLVNRYVKQLSVILGVDEESIELELAKVRDKLSARSGQDQTAEPVESPNPSVMQVPFRSEYAVISLMAEDERLARKAVDTLSGNDFRNREATEVFERIQARVAEGKEITVRAVLHWGLSDPLKSYLSAHPFQHLSSLERDKALAHCILQVRKEMKQDDLNELRAQIRQAELEGDIARVEELVREFQSRAKTR